MASSFLKGNGLQFFSVMAVCLTCLLAICCLSCSSNSFRNLLFNSKPRSVNLELGSVLLEFKGIRSSEGKGIDEWRLIKDVLEDFGCINCDSVKVGNCQEIGTIKVCDYSCIELRWYRPLADLEKLHATLQGLKGVEIGLENARAALVYRGLAAEGRISIIIRIEVTPGSKLFIDRRGENRFVRVETTGNVYRDEISLRRGQEWILYRTELFTGRETINRYFRLNVLTKVEEELTKEEFNEFRENQ